MGKIIKELCVNDYMAQNLKRFNKGKYKNATFNFCFDL